MILTRNYKEEYQRRKPSADKYWKKLRKASLEILGNKCVKCGIDDVRVLQIDHINGGGVKEKKTMTKNYYLHVINSVVNNEGKFQILCANCNWIKRVENNEVRRLKIEK